MKSGSFIILQTELFAIVINGAGLCLFTSENWINTARIKDRREQLTLDFPFFTKLIYYLLCHSSTIVSMLPAPGQEN